MTKKLPPVVEQRLRADRREQWRKCGKVIAEQAQTHRRETTALAVEHQRMQEALRGAVKLLTWLRVAGHKIWTPAYTKQLKVWEKMSE
jgi:hypothetical protein